VDMATRMEQAIMDTPMEEEEESTVTRMEETIMVIHTIMEIMDTVMMKTVIMKINMSFIIHIEYLCDYLFGGCSLHFLFQSTVTAFARLRGLSGLIPLRTASS